MTKFPSKNGMQTATSRQRCCICKDYYVGFGNNAQPHTPGRCCDECNATVVIPMRIAALQAAKAT